MAVVGPVAELQDQDRLVRVGLVRDLERTGGIGRGIGPVGWNREVLEVLSSRPGS
jgi:hypothetical protein